MAGYIGSAASVVSSGAENKKTFTITGATTSLTGLNYPVGKVHVFQNGVRLVDGTDYTATNGTTITLTVAAQSGDNVVVISQADFQVSGAVSTSGDTMTGDLTIQGAFTSQGIDDNGNATALTITSDEHVLVGTTDSAVWNDTTGTGGINLRSDSILAAARNGGEPLLLNRLGTDGELIKFNKNGTTVGSIGIQGTGFYIDGEVEHAGIRFGGSAVVPRHNNAGSNNYVNLGDSSNRFKDLYLSGGVVFGTTGGTVDSKTLDDYEEGSWTPSMSGMGNASFSQQFGRYTRIGDLAHVTGKIAWTGASGSAQVSITGLPFTAINASDDQLRNSAWPQGDYRNIPNLITKNGHFRVSGTTLFGVIDNTNGYTAGLTRSEFDTFGEFNFYLVYKTT